MKLSKTLIAGSVAAATLLASAFAPLANAEVTASVGVANMYYWRGFDLGKGDAQVSGDLRFSESGFYAGVWGASGDALNGTEYDLYAGYAGGEADGFNYDLSVWTYVYPKDSDVAVSDPGKLSEVVLTLGFGPVKVTYYDNLADTGDTEESSYNYVTASATFGAFTALIGAHNDLAAGADPVTSEPLFGSPVHVDLSYAYSDRLKFTVGKIVEDDDKFTNADAAKFVVSYNLPLEK